VGSAVEAGKVRAKHGVQQALRPCVLSRASRVVATVVAPTELRMGD
jgi:predicted Zn-dependent protease